MRSNLWESATLLRWQAIYPSSKRPQWLSRAEYLLPSARKPDANTSTVSEGTAGSKSRRVRQVFTLSNNLLPKSLTAPTEMNVSVDFSTKHFIIILIQRNYFVITDFRNLSVLVAVKWSSSRSNKNCPHFVSNKFLFTFYLWSQLKGYRWKCVQSQEIYYHHTMSRFFIKSDYIG